MHVQWYGRSAFQLATPTNAVFIDPFADLSGLTGRGMRIDFLEDAEPGLRYPQV